MNLVWTSKIIWYHPKNNWGPIIDDLVQFEEDFNSRTEMWSGGDRLSQTRPIPRSPDGDKKDSNRGRQSLLWGLFLKFCSGGLFWCSSIIYLVLQTFLFLLFLWKQYIVTFVVFSQSMAADLKTRYRLVAKMMFLISRTFHPLIFPAVDLVAKIVFQASTILLLPTRWYFQLLHKIAAKGSPSKKKVRKRPANKKNKWGSVI